jgi:hypothetical protein
LITGTRDRHHIMGRKAMQCFSRAMYFGKKRFRGEKRMEDRQLNPEREQALARLKCAHCRSLIDCDALAQAVLAEMQCRFQIEVRSDDGKSKVSDAELIGAVRVGVNRFLSGLLDDAA